MIKQNRFIALRFFLITLMIALTLILTPIVPHSTRFDRDSKTEVPTIGVQGKLVPSFCADRLPDLKMVEIANVPLPDRYPTTPGSVIYEYDSPVTFHPLQALLPYLVALDNRALLGKVSREVDGAALIRQWQIFYYKGINK